MVKEDSDWLRHGGERPKLNKKLEEWSTKYSLLEIENAQLRSYPDM